MTRVRTRSHWHLAGAGAMAWAAAMGGFTPGTARASQTLPGYTVIALGRGHNNRMCLAATIGGKKGLIILDTGAGSTTLSEASYRFLLSANGGALPKGVPKTAPVNGVTMPLAVAPHFTVGRLDLGTSVVPLVSRRYLYDQSPYETGGRTYDGLLGENFLRHYNAVVDCGRLALYLNTDPARKLSLRDAFIRNGWTRVPMSDLGNDFTVPCTLNGHAFRAIVDTGAPFTNMNRSLLLGAGVASRDIPFRSGLIGTVPVMDGLARMDRFQVGDYVASNVHLTTVPISFARFGGPHDSAGAAPIVGLLGSDFLANNSAVVDVGNKALYLKRRGQAATHG